MDNQRSFVLKNNEVHEQTTKGENQSCLGDEEVLVSEQNCKGTIDALVREKPPLWQECHQVALG